MVFVRILLTCVVSLLALSAAAQTPAPPPAPAPAPGTTQANGLPINWTSWQWEQEGDHLRLVGQVDLQPPGTNVRFFADEIDLYLTTSRLVATGNVVFTNPEGRIAAESVEFNWADGTATFNSASGIMSLGPMVDRAQFGGQDPDVYFYGDKIEKVAARRYKITQGGFSTCVQPTPRWEVTSETVTMNLDEYAVARNMVLRVKGVPLFYLPLIYYPIQDDERATGFLMPTYGASTLRGQSLSNAFFWAINRSQDATFFHDWFTRTGQGFGGEYRYVSNLASSGSVRAYRFDQHATTYTDSGTVRLLPESTSYQVLAAVTQSLGGTVRARGRVDYFSDVTSQQLYQQNVHYATRASRVIDAGISAGAGWLSLSGQYLRNEVFDNETRSVVYGSTPRILASVAPQQIAGTPIYGSVNTDYAYLPYRDVNRGVIVLDNSLGRMDIRPALRVPLSKLTYLSLTQTATAAATYYSRSLDPRGRMVDESIIRRALTVRTEAIGPVFNKIWDTPDSVSALRRKHVIEPTFTFDYVTEIANQTQVPLLSDVSDFIIGGAARLQYGLNNRLFSRARPRDGVPGTTGEILSVGVFQTFYTDPLASRYDTFYVSGPNRVRPVDLSPVALLVRVSPTPTTSATARLEYDVSGEGMQILTGTTSAQIVGSTVAGQTGPQITANVSFSRYRYAAEQDPQSYLSVSTNSRWLQGRVGATYALSWDIARGYVQSQSVMGSYMAQCCGVQADFQTVNYPSGFGFPIPSDRRFNFSFVLAGLGTFTNFFGAFGQR